MWSPDNRPAFAGWALTFWAPSERLRGWSRPLSSRRPQASERDRQARGQYDRRVTGTVINQPQQGQAALQEKGLSPNIKQGVGMSVTQQWHRDAGKGQYGGLSHVPQQRYTGVLTPGSQNVTLFGHRVFADGIRSGASSTMTGVFMKIGNLDTYRIRGETRWGRQHKRATWESKYPWGHQKLGEKLRTDSLSQWTEGTNLPIPWSWISSLQTWDNKCLLSKFPSRVILLWQPK